MPGLPVAGSQAGALAEEEDVLVAVRVDEICRYSKSQISELQKQIANTDGQLLQLSFIESVHPDVPYAAFLSQYQLVSSALRRKLENAWGVASVTVDIEDLKDTWVFTQKSAEQDLEILCMAGYLRGDIVLEEILLILVLAGCVDALLSFGTTLELEIRETIDHLLNVTEIILPKPRATVAQVLKELAVRYPDHREYIRDGCIETRRFHGVILYISLELMKDEIYFILDRLTFAESQWFLRSIDAASMAKLFGVIKARILGIEQTDLEGFAVFAESMRALASVIESRYDAAIKFAAEVDWKGLMTEASLHVTATKCMNINEVCIALLCHAYEKTNLLSVKAQIVPKLQALVAFFFGSNSGDHFSSMFAVTLVLSDPWNTARASVKSRLGSRVTLSQRLQVLKNDMFGSDDFIKNAVGYLLRQKARLLREKDLDLDSLCLCLLGCLSHIPKITERDLQVHRFDGAFLQILTHSKLLITGRVVDMVEKYATAIGSSGRRALSPSESQLTGLLQPAMKRWPRFPLEEGYFSDSSRSKKRNELSAFLLVTFYVLTLNHTWQLQQSDSGSSFFSAGFMEKFPLPLALEILEDSEFLRIQEERQKVRELHGHVLGLMKVVHPELLYPTIQLQAHHSPREVEANGLRSNAPLMSFHQFLCRDKEEFWVISKRELAQLEAASDAVCDPDSSPDVVFMACQFILTFPPTAYMHLADSLIGVLLPRCLSGNPTQLMLETVQRIYSTLFSVIPKHVTLCLVNALTDGESWNWTTLDLDPLVLFKINRKVFEIPSCYTIFLETLRLVLTSARNRQTSMWTLARTRRKYWSGFTQQKLQELFILQSSLVVQQLFEITATPSLSKIERNDIFDKTADFLHKSFIEREGQLHILAKQGFDRDAVSEAVKNIPSFHVLFRHLPDLLSIPNHRVLCFVVYIASVLTEKYPLKSTLELSQSYILPALDTLLRGLVPKRSAVVEGLWKSNAPWELEHYILPSFLTLSKAFPCQIPDIIQTMGQFLAALMQRGDDILRMDGGTGQKLLNMVKSQCEQIMQEVALAFIDFMKTTRTSDVGDR